MFFCLCDAWLRYVYFSSEKCYYCNPDNFIGYLLTLIGDTQVGNQEDPKCLLNAMYDAIPGSNFQSKIISWELVTLFCENGCDAYSPQMKLGHSEGTCVINL